MDDAGGGRHDAEVGEGLLAPAQELVALAVAVELDLRVALQRLRRAEHVHLHRVVHHQVHRHQRVDAPRVAAQPLHRRAHGGQVHHGGNAGEVLQDHAARHEGQLHLGGVVRLPAAEVAHVFFGDQLAVHVAQHRLEQDLDREGQPVQAGRAPAAFQRVAAGGSGPGPAAVSSVPRAPKTSRFIVLSRIRILCRAPRAGWTLRVYPKSLFLLRTRKRSMVVSARTISPGASLSVGHVRPGIGDGMPHRAPEACRPKRNWIPTSTDLARLGRVRDFSPGTFEQALLHGTPRVARGHVLRRLLLEWTGRRRRRAGGARDLGPRGRRCTAQLRETLGPPGLAADRAPARVPQQARPAPRAAAARGPRPLQPARQRHHRPAHRPLQPPLHGGPPQPRAQPGGAPGRRRLAAVHGPAGVQGHQRPARPSRWATACS